MPGETAEQARTRRRWITLAEFVAVAGLLIGALTLYLNWSDRRADEAEKASAAAAEDKAKAIVTLTGKVADDGATIALSDPAHEISGATVRFPDALGVAPRDAMPGPAIDADWIAAPLLALTDKGADERQGRVPALVTVTWWDGDTKRESSALYDILWRTEGRLLQGRTLRLTGIALKSRRGTPAALEAAWRPPGR
jgi:predicted RecA/RadA family phage recombinase